MQITIKRGNILSQIESPISRDLYTAISEAIQYRPEGYQWMPRYKAGTWDGYISLLKTRGQTPRTYPTGLEHKVLDAIQRKGYDVTFRDSGIPHLGVLGEFTPDGPGTITLRDYQKEAVQAIEVNKRGIINLPTGTGKTVIIGAAVERLRKRYTLVVVYHSRDLLRQTSKSLSEFLGITVGQYGDGLEDWQDVTVAISDSLVKAINRQDPVVLDYLNGVDVFIADETHHMRADTLQQCSEACRNARYRIGLSGTPFRDQGDDLEVEAYIGREIYARRLSWMVERGYLCPMSLYRINLDASSWVTPPIPPPEIVEGEYETDEDGLVIVDENGIPVPKTKKKRSEYQHFLRHYVWENRSRNTIIAAWATMLAKKGRKGLVMCTSILQGEMIHDILCEKSGLGSEALDFVQGADSSEVRRQVIADLDSGGKQIVVCTTIFQEGIDVPPASFLIPAQPYRSTVITIQQQGRVLRPHPAKDKAIVVDINDCRFKERKPANWLGRQARRRLQYFQSEPCIRDGIIEKDAKL